MGVKLHIDELEVEIAYAGISPLMGSLEELQAKLDSNRAELERLRRNAPGTGEDEEYTIEQLEDQNKALREEMNNLKKQLQQTEGANANFGETTTSRRGGEGVNR